MPSDTSETTLETAEAEAPVASDPGREALLEALTTELGDAVLQSHLEPGKDLTVRVTAAAWGEIGAYIHERQRFRFFEYLSAIDWMPSPFGRSMSAAVDLEADAANTEDAEEPEEAVAGEGGGFVTGLAGGDTRFQVFARVHNLTTNLGLTLKADVGDDLLVGSWTTPYPGAEWHEREVWEMFGISFLNHPGLRPLYLPGDFEGNPMRKDFPLLSRLIKPWPGIVDVEPMPEVEEPEVTGSDATDPAAAATEADT